MNIEKTLVSFSLARLLLMHFCLSVSFPLGVIHWLRFMILSCPKVFNLLQSRSIAIKIISEVRSELNKQEQKGLSVKYILFISITCTCI